MTIGDRVKLRREELGMSVDDLADKLGKSRATIYRYESKEIENMSIKTLEPLAKALDTTQIYLLGIENECPVKYKNNPLDELNEDDKKFVMEFINKIR